MSIIWEWSDPFVEMFDLHKGECFLSGEKLEPPFMVWHGQEIITINAKSMGKQGKGFELDIAILSFLGSKMDSGHNLGRVREMMINRMKSPD